MSTIKKALEKYQERLDIRIEEDYCYRYALCDYIKHSRLFTSELYGEFKKYLVKEGILRSPKNTISDEYFRQGVCYLNEEVATFRMMVLIDFLEKQGWKYE